MLPGPPAHHTRNREDVHPVLTGQCCKLTALTRIPPADLQDLRCSQARYAATFTVGTQVGTSSGPMGVSAGDTAGVLTSVVFIASRTAPYSPRVAGVVHRSSEIQMLRTYASRIATARATMQDP